MAGLSTYAEGKAFDHFFRATAYTPAATVYMALFSAIPNDDGTGGTEMVGTGYARQAIAFGAYSSRRIANSGTITFTNSGVGGWPAAVGWGIYDASSSGNLLCTGTLSPTTTVGASTSFSLLAGEVIIDYQVHGPWLAQKVLELLFKNTAATPPATVYGALFSVAPTNDGTGGTEITASGYTRKACTFAALSSKRGYLTGNVSFTAAAPVSWGAIPAVAWYDASSSGNFMATSAISPSPTVASGAPFSLLATSTYVGLD